jgi:lysine-ketoglutarate reductase/saccharopine dehydrogenase-like protein (TIGR00300 family)
MSGRRRRLAANLNSAMAYGDASGDAPHGALRVQANASIAPGEPFERPSVQCRWSDLRGPLHRMENFIFGPRWIMEKVSTDAEREELYVEEVEVTGHIIDSLILPKVLDLITDAGGSFRIKRMTVGQGRQDPSYALVEVKAPSPDRLAAIVAEIGDHGAVPTATTDARLVAADIAGTFPEGFYSTTNQRTEVRIGGRWIEVSDQEMDCGIAVDPNAGTARCVAMTDVRLGEQLVVGHGGVRVFPYQRDIKRSEFEFMSSGVSTEKPKGVAIRQIAQEMFRVKQSGGKNLIVGGPAVVHTGSDEHLCELIRRGYVHRLFAGNALATHDIEQSLFGTSLGVHLDRGDSVEHGHEHHLRAINRIRRLGGIRQAVEQGALTSGIMYECVKNNVPYMLAGSIRDDGPLPDVVTDALEAQRLMREQVRDVSFCLMIATMLHSVAVGNLLPAWVKVVCVDINPSTVIKLSDRGSFQTVGLVTDVEPFLRLLVQEIAALERK